MGVVQCDCVQLSSHLPSLGSSRYELPNSNVHTPTLACQVMVAKKESVLLPKMASCEFYVAQFVL